MTPEKTKKIFDDISILIKDVYVGAQINIEPARLTNFGSASRDEPTIELINHILYMCDQGKNFVDQGHIEKAARWLGWIQGVLYATKFMSLEEQMNMNRTEETP